tara:strand:+ start:33 stop:302 length:270 start_codon:yes stop_codon:yes gene_type:complete
MKIKKLTNTEYEIETKEDLIYVSKERNPGTKDLYVYFIDVFLNDNDKNSKVQWGENFDDLDELFNCLVWDYNIPEKFINKMKGMKDERQ